MAVLTLVKKAAVVPSISFESLMHSVEADREAAPETINEAEVDQDIQELVQEPQDEAMLVDASEQELQALESHYLNIRTNERLKFGMECLCQSLQNAQGPVTPEEQDRVALINGVLMDLRDGAEDSGDEDPIIEFSAEPSRPAVVAELEEGIELAQECILDALASLKWEAPKLYASHSRIQALAARYGV